MNANVVEFTPVWSGWTSSEKVPAASPNGSSRLKTGSDRPKADLAQISDGDQGTPPFWTWFIENPRRVSA